jgi:hypothetical protein
VAAVGRLEQPGPVTLDLEQRPVQQKTITVVLVVQEQPPTTRADLHRHPATVVVAAVQREAQRVGRARPVTSASSGPIRRPNAARL